MLRRAGCHRFLHQRQERFLQNVLGFAMAQAQGAAVKDQARRFRFVQLPEPINVFNVVHAFVIWTPLAANLYKLFSADAVGPAPVETKNP